ncbi:ATP-binding protein [Bacillus sp. V3B]|uniref:ATP-binding protein n=1 Tax=Bacillus sp. V3B TaxID=2804915 RepID=UPI00210D5339|nr:ATP-binding protein [Bacillus sp. V3B]MCQ6276947.1 ATP-binding protein [Bacillus sp. V3B]
MKRDVLVIPMNEWESLVISSDNSGAIGLKEKDVVKTLYEVVAYYGFRVAVMECMAAGGVPLSVVIHNFCEDDSWEAIVNGVGRGLAEMGMVTVPITGSTESNFMMLQSALGMVVIGKRDRDFQEEPIAAMEMKLAVIGSPLVGKEVLDKEREVLPLSLFQEICQLDDVVVLPVGSKGVLHELKVMLGDHKLVEDDWNCEVDLRKSTGPSTCILIAFPPNAEPIIKQLTSDFYHPLQCQAP